MAFFNLTALGPTNIFLDKSKNQSKLHLFTEEDLDYAFKMTSKEADTILVEEMVNLFNTMYRGPFNPSDLETFMKDIHPSTKRLTLNTLRKALVRVQKNHDIMDTDSDNDPSLIHDVSNNSMSNLNNKSPNRNYTSYQEYGDATHRHVRVPQGPKQVWKEPLTSSQDWGWTVDTFDYNSQKIQGKKSCPETIYASELVKSGINY